MIRWTCPNQYPRFWPNEVQSTNMIWQLGCELFNLAFLNQTWFGISRSNSIATCISYWGFDRMQTNDLDMSMLKTIDRIFIMPILKVWPKFKPNRLTYWLRKHGSNFIMHFQCVLTDSTKQMTYWLLARNYYSEFVIMPLTRVDQYKPTWLIYCKINLH